jgi:hypothetical protein
MVTGTATFLFLLDEIGGFRTRPAEQVRREADALCNRWRRLAEAARLLGACYGLELSFFRAMPADRALAYEAAADRLADDLVAAQRDARGGTADPV